jgi:hypothetical protein
MCRIYVRPPKQETAKKKLAPKNADKAKGRVSDLYLHWEIWALIMASATQADDALERNP